MINEWQTNPAPRSPGLGTAPPGLTPPPTRTARGDGDVPLQEVLVELWQNVEKLVRQEVTLARAELETKAAKLKADLIASAAGAVLALASVFALVATVILLLDQVMPAWLAALITSAATGATGFALLKKGTPSASDVKPERTIANLKRDFQTIREAGK